MTRLRHLARLLYELTAFAVVNRLYWPLLLAVVLLLMAGLVVVGQTAAPMIYTLF